jgi:type I site-specific restriction endonuclease
MPSTRVRPRQDGSFSTSGRSITLQGRITIKEYQTGIGPADYVLFADRKALGIVEAKPDRWGAKITTVEAQSSGYAGAHLITFRIADWIT